MTTSILRESNSLNKILSIVATLLFIVVLWLGYLLSHPPKVRAIDDPSPLIVREVKEVSELAAAMFEMETVVPVSEKGGIAESNLLYIAHGNVRVGVKLSEFKADDVQVKKDEILVTLPPLKVLDSKLDLEHSEVYSYNRGFLGWGPDVIKLQAQAQREALKKVEEAACQKWLIQTANERVQKTVEHLLNEGFKNNGYKITVKTQAFSKNSCARVQV